MFYRNTNDSKHHNNIRIVSLAAGLALATAAVIGGSNLLKENRSTSTAPVTPRVERIAPQFGTAADAVHASQNIRAPSQFGSMTDAVSATESIRPQANSIDSGVGPYLGLGQAAVGQSFATMADAGYAAVGLAYVQPATVPNAAVDTRHQALGIAQPAVGQSFDTMADAVSATESIRPQGNSVDTGVGPYLGLGQAAVGQSFATMTDAVSATQSMLTAQEAASVSSTSLGNFLGLGQPGEGSNSAPQFGTMADADYASR